MTEHRIDTRQEWQAARDELLRLEKEHTRMGDDLARMRRELPWVRVEKEYRFDTGDGSRTLAELFDGRSQLLIYHFMFGPSYVAGCPTCSSSADAVNAVLPHLHARDVTMLYVSRAPIERLLTYEERMGWSFPWVSCGDNDFNFDLGFSYTDEQVNEFVEPLLESGPPPILDANAAASGTDVAGYLTEGPGFSVFAKDDGVVYHTYSTQARGLEFLMGYYPDPRSGTEGPRRGRRDAALAPAARRVLDHSSRAGPDATGRRLIRIERGEEDGARGQGAGIIPRRATPRALRDDRS
jgi:predicted dithiol-disulfide oxidoreductase (DUF899 family)